MQEIKQEIIIVFLSFLHITIILYMFIHKFIALKGLNILHKIFNLLNWIFCIKSYDSLWYTAPVATRKLLLIIMINIMKPCQYKMFGGLFKGNIEGFAQVINSSTIKYFGIALRRDMIE